jgi:hypothetical protein
LTFRARFGQAVEADTRPLWCDGDAVMSTSPERGSDNASFPLPITISHPCVDHRGRTSAIFQEQQMIDSTHLHFIH